jgi:hypothetical protein
MTNARGPRSQESRSGFRAFPPRAAHGLPGSLRALALGATLLLLGGGCSSSSSTTEVSGAVASAPSGAGSSSASSDPNCTTTLARSGASCTVDCTIPCGYMRLGTKVCSCVGDRYSMCVCARPSSFLGAARAPYCPTADGTTAPLKNTPCTTEWEECIGKEPIGGNTPQGCVCMTDPTVNALQWKCGSTNKWFAPAAPAM